MEPTKIYDNGDLLYVAGKGKLLLQVETGNTYTKAFEPANGKHFTYEEIDEESIKAISPITY